MPLRTIEITAPADNTNRIQEIAEKRECLDTWHSAKNKDGRRSIKMLVTLDEQQKLTDDLQSAMDKDEDWRIVVYPVEATIPKQEEIKPNGDDKKKKNESTIVRGTLTREELYNEVWKGARVDFNLIILVVLSTIVCGIGLLQNNIAVVIGAMVIAPLLGPNLALAFGAAIGDKGLIIESIKSNVVGLGTTLALAAMTGFFLSEPAISEEIRSRTNVGFDAPALALAAGAAAVLSMTTGLSSALVGVMVAVALMPPAVTLGLMVGMAHWNMAYGAGLLLLTNIVCISIAAQAVFLLKGVKPRTWYERKKSEQSTKVNIAFWAVLFIALSVLIPLRKYWETILDFFNIPLS